MALTLVAILVAFVLNQIREKGVRPLLFPTSWPLADFTLTNQLGRPVSLRDLKGHVWIANIIFTRCAGPCPRLTAQISELQTALARNPSVKLVSLTTDPEYDTPAVLRQYAEHFKADPARWFFLTGSKAQIAGVAIDGLKLTAVEKDPAKREDAADLFIHSLLMVVVDKRGDVRAAFESTEEGWKDKVLTTARYLERRSAP